MKKGILGLLFLILASNLVASAISQAEEKASPVGGGLSPIDKLSLLAPYIAFAAALIAITIGALYAGKRWFGKAVFHGP